jgi:MscS family membrane protein
VSIEERARAPLVFLFGLGLFRLSVPYFGLYEPAWVSVEVAMRSTFWVGVFWLLLRLVDVAEHRLVVATWMSGRETLRAILPLGARLTRFGLGLLATLAAVSALGYPVGSILAGLGIGGIALALAAQKTVENLFGSLSIGLDRPMQRGDAVRVEGIEGTVEEIGLRSTQVRTADRTLVTIPNAKLADSRIESLAARDKFRLSLRLGLVFGTTAAQVRAVVAGIEALLQAHPLVDPGSDVIVRLVDITNSALVVDVQAWFLTGSWMAFLPVREDVLLGILEAVEKAGTTLAFPSQTLYVVGGELQPSSREAPREDPGRS